MGEKLFLIVKWIQIKIKLLLNTVLKKHQLSNHLLGPQFRNIRLVETWYKQMKKDNFIEETF